MKIEASRKSFFMVSYILLDLRFNFLLWLRIVELMECTII